MNLTQLCADLKVDAVLGLDFETYYAKGYSLSMKTLGMTEYITDPQFKVHMCSVQWHDERKARVLSHDEFKAFVKTVNWNRVAVLAHNTPFDGLILSHHYGAIPAFYLDTMSMARALLPVGTSIGLDSVSRVLGGKGKVGRGSLENVMGVRDLTPKQYKALARYAGNDIEQTFYIFKKLAPCLPMRELRLIDITVKMYARPTVLTNKDAIDKVYTDEVAGKAKQVKRLKVDKTELVSNDKFAELLRAAGVEPPMKLPVKLLKALNAGEVAHSDIKPEDYTYAMAKGDLAFKDLLKHPDKKVRQLMEARLAVKSSIVETRSRRMSARSYLGPQPIALKYAGAKTWRWSGDDLSNWQNLGRGSDLRTSIEAQPKHSLVIADLAQIEARINAWFAGQDDIVDAFRAYDSIIGWKLDAKGRKVPIREGADVYSVTAAEAVFNKHVDKITVSERFLGKVCVLLLGYQAGPPRYAETLRLGAYGDPVDISDERAAEVVKAWRAKNHRIVANWKNTKNAAFQAFRCHRRNEHGVVAFEGFEKRGVMHLPGDIAMRYDRLENDTEGSGMSYATEYRVKKDGEIFEARTRLYGGILVENMVQALARQVIAEQMVAIADALPNARIVMSTHDEVVIHTHDRSVNRALNVTREIMSVPPAWAPGLPIAVDIHASKRYDK